MNSVLGKIFDTLISFVNLFRFWVVIYEFEEGIILRLGKFHKKLIPGFHWKLPLSIDEVFWLNIRKKTSDSWEMTLTTKEGQTVTISFDMIIEVIDAEKALLAVDDWVHVGYTTAKIILSQMVDSKDIETIMSAKFTDDVHQTINSVLEMFGIRVYKFGITDKARSRAYRFFLGAGK